MPTTTLDTPGEWELGYLSLKGRNTSLHLLEADIVIHLHRPHRYKGITLLIEGGCVQPVGALHVGGEEPCHVIGC